MKLIAEITLTKIDEGVKGEELREELSQQLDGIEIEGYEISSRIVDGNEKKDRSKDLLGDVKAIAKLLQLDFSSPSPFNSKITVKENLDHIISIIERK